MHRDFFGGFIFPRGGQGIFESGGTTDGFFYLRAHVLWEPRGARKATVLERRFPRASLTGGRVGK